MRYIKKNSLRLSQIKPRMRETIETIETIRTKQFSSFISSFVSNDVIVGDLIIGRELVQPLIWLQFTREFDYFSKPIFIFATTITCVLSVCLSDELFVNSNDQWVAYNLNFIEHSIQVLH